jgi:hypothetical protein
VGLGATLELVRDVVTLDMLEQALRRKAGGYTRSETAQTIVSNTHNGRPAS